LLKKAMISLMQLMPEDSRMALDLGEEEARLTMDGQIVATLRVHRHDALTERAARDLELPEAPPPLLYIDRSSPQARAVLRERGYSYAANNGELWIHVPPVHVERPPQRGNPKLTSAFASPFAVRASRVPRWLLLKPGARPSITELSRAVELSEAVVSRTVRVLADDALVAVHVDSADGRLRRVELRSPGLMLDAFERATATRRVRRQTWDIGARDVEEVMRRVRVAAKRLQLPYAIGGLAGASIIHGPVEPVLVDVWVGRAGLDVWMEELEGIPTRPAPGRLTIQAAPDPFIFSLATRTDDVFVADSVQLYLDCRRRGERALEAAESIREEMGW
jgi:DNA-binding MarR family transcriptional regulator